MELLSFSLLLLLVPGSSPAKRVKRVFNGLPVEGRNVYSVTQYNVWISNSHECDVDVPGPVKDWIGIHSIPTGRRGCQPSVHNLRGGGALITPRVVQTACHVIANFNKDSGKYTLGPAIVLDAFEQHFTVYPGWNTVSQFTVGIFVGGYYTHQRCAWLVGFNSERIVFDYGWIVLLDYLDFKYEGLKVNFAPGYTVYHLSEIWTASKMKQSTCLVMGWGWYDDKNPGASAVLRHGWVIHLSYWECYKRSDVFSPPQAKFKFVYSRDASWDCALSIPHFNQTHGPGDSGSPVTCDNQYVGVVSWGSYFAGLLGYHAPIAFSPYENAIEFRKSFVQSLEDNAYHPEHYTNLPSPTPWTPAPELRLFENPPVDQQDMFSFRQSFLPTSKTIVLRGFRNLIAYSLAIEFSFSLVP